ncbi:hypothetical protein CROQUDRAFT_713273 [Cronartium quercuum f. sp. fusiforme G11]|uniref:Uncharacterized protein n=1 Tax=Cronartium quercuum f. sp. fusiforme G11 TaxID=708437 RepID=A0A9P6TFM6_9BASI|nr:hypothetical protein CROQUDRAFT_713273 [Cronartium quercuum f. sp. fusiforme G11]
MIGQCSIFLTIVFIAIIAHGCPIGNTEPDVVSSPCHKQDTYQYPTAPSSPVTPPQSTEIGSCGNKEVGSCGGKVETTSPAEQSTPPSTNEAPPPPTTPSSPTALPPPITSVPLSMNETTSPKNTSLSTNKNFPPLPTEEFAHPPSFEIPGKNQIQGYSGPSGASQECSCGEVDKNKPEISNCHSAFKNFKSEDGLIKYGQPTTSQSCPTCQILIQSQNGENIAVPRVHLQSSFHSLLRQCPGRPGKIMMVIGSSPSTKVFLSVGYYSGGKV